MGVLMKYLISPQKRQFKANLHCHSVLSDGKLTPEQLKAAYKDHGYSILAITDHEHPFDHSDLSDEDFLMLTGYEAYIRPDFNNLYDKFNPEIHINLLAKDPHNTAIVGYARECIKYMPDEELDRAVKLGPKEKRRYTPGYVNRFIEVAKENGYLAAYNHPYWSLEDMSDIMGYRGFFSMEMCNYSSFLQNRLEYNGQIYDALLRRGTRIACHSADDNHNKEPFGSPKSDSFGGATQILADDLSYESVIRALEKGDFYSTMGPEIYEVSVSEGVARIHCSPADVIIMHDGSKQPFAFYAEKGGKIAEATAPIRDEAPYIRFTVMTDGYRFADTRGFFRDEFDF